VEAVKENWRGGPTGPREGLRQGVGIAMRPGAESKRIGRVGLNVGVEGVDRDTQCVKGS